METITVSKERLLTTLKENRDRHEEIFLRAQEVYRRRVIEVLDERLQQARAGKPVSTYINLIEPVNYTDEFDRAITAVEWAEGATITLGEVDVQRYIMNQWGWAAKFAAATQSYVGAE